MTAAWFNELEETVKKPEFPKDEGSSIWDGLHRGLDVNEAVPTPNPGVIAEEVRDGSKHYFVLKNTSQKTYLRLSAEEYKLWLLMDGKKSVKEVVVENFLQSGAFAHNLAAKLTVQLRAHHMLVEEPLYVWNAIKEQLQKRSWLHKVTLPAQALLSQQLKIPGVDRIVTALYRAAGWAFFTRPMQILMFLIAVAGFVLFNRIIADPDYVLFSALHPSELALFWLASLSPILIHELGHALTVKHYKREINSGGLLLYFGMPAAYVDTTDIWLESRRARLNVTWNGPYTGFIVGGLCAMFMWFNPGHEVNSFLFKMASVAYLTILININPLLKYDGYYILSDALDISFLRERSLNFLQKSLSGKLARREKFTRDEKIFSVFGVLSFIWTAYAIYLAVTFWRTRVSSSMQVLFGDNFDLIAKAFEFLSIAAFISLLLLLLLQTARFIVNLIGRFTQTGGLQRHGQLALIGLAVTALISFGAAATVEIYRGWIVVAIVSTTCIATWISFLTFNNAYHASARWRAQIALSFIPLLLGLAPLAEELLPTGSAFARYLFFAAGIFSVLGGLLFMRPAIKQIKPLQVAIGILVGAGLAGIGYTFRIFNWTLGPIPFIGLIFALNWFNLRGSGRLPALGLIYLGIIVSSVMFEQSRYIPRWWGFGVLIVCSGFWHLILARLPSLSKVEAIISSNKRDAIAHSVSVLVRRIIAQVYFESGWGGIESFGGSFTEHTKKLGINLSIAGNQFKDGELSQRATFDLTEVYGAAFDKIFELMRQRFGHAFAHKIIGLGVDLIPWQYREVIGELVLARRDWGDALNKEASDQRSNRIKLLDRVPLFVSATYDDLRPIAAMLVARQYAAGEVIITQGEPGREFFIIESGKVQVWQRQGEGESTQVNSLGPGQFFGEAALATDEPRNATIIAETPSVLLSLGREDFDSLVKHHVEFASKLKSTLNNKWILRNMPVFDELDVFDLNFIASKLKSESFKAGEFVFKQGDVGDKFYIIESGEIGVYREANGSITELERHTAGDYFGETALIQNKPRNASIKAITDTNLFSLAREEFNDMLGDFNSMRQSIEKTSTRRVKNIN